jgi:beta-galactosidase
MVPDANNIINFKIEGQGEIVATDNGDPANLVSFSSHDREAYNGMALVIIRANKGNLGKIKLIITSNGLDKAVVEIKSN